LEFIQSSPNFNCGWAIYTGVEEQLFHKMICIFEEVFNVTNGHHWAGGGVSLAG
jgi:hypothetical protein